MRFQIPLNNLRSESQCFNRSIINFFGFQYCNKRSTCTSFERGWHQISSSDDNDTGKEKVFTKKLFRHCSPFPHLNPCSLKVIGIPSQNHSTWSWQHDAAHQMRSPSSSIIHWTDDPQGFPSLITVLHLIYHDEKRHSCKGHNSQ